MTKKKTRLKISSLILASLILSLSYYVISNCWKGLSHTYIEEDWDVVQGVILSPDLKLQGKENVKRAYQGLQQTINYEYEVNGVKYRSNSVSKEEHVTQDAFPEGASVNVYYNPGNTNDSVLVRTKAQTPYLYAIIAFFLLLSAVTVFGLIKDFLKA